MMSFCWPTQPILVSISDAYYKDNRLSAQWLYKGGSVARIYPSLISADLLNLAQVLKSLDSQCDGYHIDIMDNHFVPNLTWGSQFVNAIGDATDLPLWVHLMVDNPDDWVELLDLPDDSIYSFHIEAVQNAKSLIESIRENKWKSSIAIKPETPVESIFDLLEDIDQVLIMSVEPGFSGQPFLPGTIKKIKPLLRFRDDNELNFTIGLDGGINKHNIEKLVDHGADDLAIASGIFHQKDPAKALKELRELTMK
jgi:ribulose-phosphate 3-epimerase